MSAEAEAEGGPLASGPLASGPLASGPDQRITVGLARSAALGHPLLKNIKVGEKREK